MDVIYRRLFAHVEPTFVKQQRQIDVEITLLTYESIFNQLSTIS